MNDQDALCPLPDFTYHKGSPFGYTEKSQEESSNIVTFLNDDSSGKVVKKQKIHSKAKQKGRSSASN